MRTLVLTAGCLLILACAVSVSVAGTVIVVDLWAYDQHSESGTQTMYLDENRVRIEFKGKETDIAAIYRLENKDDPVMWLIDTKAQAYTEFDKKGLKKIQDQMLQGKEMMDTYMAQMSAEEREQLKQQYRKQMREANKHLNYDERMKKMKYEKVESGVEMNEWTCEHYKAMFEKELYQEVWVCDPKEMGVEAKDLAVLNTMAGLFKSFAGELIPLVDAKTEGSDEKINGFPLKTVLYEDGNKIMRTEVKEVRKEDLEPSLFDLPEGLDQKTLE
ncbi:MAG: DUF4412 domain-containing protein [Candidatus Latescibacterota bacterium]|nr:MAG: DUF4412 domain-containing protein [Candidatus Latescibacterota bacterium]